MTDVPVALRGVWRRRDLSLDGGDPFEYQDAWWLQGARHFVDVRRDRDGTPGTAFAGTTEAGPDRVRWNHEIQVGWEGGDDEATYFLAGDHLTEHGTIDLGDGPQPYGERWERMDAWAPSARIGSAVGGPGRLVAIGGYVGVVVDVAASCAGWLFRRGHDGWDIVTASHDVSTAPAPSPLLDNVAGPSPLSWTLQPEDER